MYSDFLGSYNSDFDNELVGSLNGDREGCFCPFLDDNYPAFGTDVNLDIISLDDMDIEPF